jgi:hypothetical protein
MPSLQIKFESLRIKPHRMYGLVLRNVQLITIPILDLDILCRLVSVFVLIVAGLVLYLGWVLHFDKDTKEFDNGSGGGGICLEKPPTPS